jgi:ligand-binding sensor domain-containing protein
MAKGLFILIISFSVSVFAQTNYSGIPKIQNYPKSEYNGGTQNWTISQDRNGFIYFANNDGLLSFNGIEWELTKVSSNSPLRAILAHSNDAIYAGLINDFGIVDTEKDSRPVFKSLKHLLPEKYQEFDDIWRIHEADGGIVFQCYKYIFFYKGDSIEVIKPRNQFHFSFMIGDRLIVHEQGGSLYEFNDGNLVELSWWNPHIDKDICFILEAGSNKLLIGTTNNGVYIFENGQVNRWNVPVNEDLIKNRLFSAAILPGDCYAFGTILNGIIISDTDGHIEHSLSIEEGMQNNTVLSLFVDRTENLWVGLDNGIDYVEINSPLSYIGSTKIGTGYCAKVFKGNLYLGTNQGLYVKPFNSSSSAGDFELVGNTAGQVWTLEEFDGQLFCGHNKGTFLVNERTASKICNEEGAWKYIPLQNDPDIIVAGHYQGLVLFKKSNNEWRFYKKVEGFNESSRYLFEDRDGYLWIGHSGKGIFKAELNTLTGTITEVIRYSDKEGLPSDVGNILFKCGEDLFVSTHDGIYEYEKNSDSFKPSEEMNGIFSDNGKLKTVSKDNKGNIWFIADSGTGFIRQNEDMTYTKVTIPFEKLKGRYVNEFEFIYPFTGENIIIGLEDGFVNYSPGVTKKYNQQYSAFITRVELPYIDSVLFFRSAVINDGYEFPFRNNSFRFHFAAPYFENDIPLEFSYFVEGLSNEWSEWTQDAYKDFTNLREGSYTLSLKSKNIYGVESEPASFSFEISPPWRRSTMAYSLYLFLFLIFLYLAKRYFDHRVRLSAIRQEEKHKQELKEREDRFQREALLAEKEIIGLRNEKLLAESVFRNKELADQTMGIINKNKFLTKVYEDLGNIQDYVTNSAAKSKIYGVKKRIKKEIDIKHQEKIFKTYFDEANEELFRRLKEKYPDLTTYDLRLCAFIKMNLSTKEISSILNISFRGAEVSRYRLRKKMDLPREINLSAHIAGF